MSTSKDLEVQLNIKLLDTECSSVSQEFLTKGSTGQQQLILEV